MTPILNINLDNMDEVKKAQLEFVEREAGNFGKLFSWVLCIALPVLIYYYAPKYGVSREVSIFLAIMSVTLVMWIAELLPDFVPGLFAILLFFKSDEMEANAP